MHYELGLAHALGRPTLLVAPQRVPLFFDVDQERLITYDRNNVFWGTELQRVLVKALVETVAQSQTAIPSEFMHIKPTQIESDEVTVRLRRIEEQLADLSRSLIAARPQIQSGFAEKIQSPLAAQAEAVRRLRTLSPPGRSTARPRRLPAGNGRGRGVRRGQPDGRWPLEWSTVPLICRIANIAGAQSEHAIRA